MKVIDSHVHLYPEPVIEKELNISKEDVSGLLTELSGKIAGEKISRALVYLIDGNVLSKDFEVPENLIVSAAVGIHGSYEKDLLKAASRGIKVIKILPYDQEILRKDYPRVLEVAEFAEEKGMILSICSTYGSKLLFDTNGVELAAYLKKKADVPVILAHGGGPKVFEAMSLAVDYDDIFLDLSFSLKYWDGSSVISDYAFAIKKLGCRKCFYGSDYPYVGFSESMDYFMRFMEKYGFSGEEKEMLLHLNFEEFAREYL